MLTVRSLCTISLLSCVLATCREGFKRVGTKCYIISDNEMEWIMATEFCLEKKAQMLVVESATEREILLPFFKSEGIELSCYWKGVWTAINCLKKDRDFVVHPTNEQIPFNMWGPDQPNNSYQKCVPLCYHYKPAKLVYHDWDCDSTRFRAVCQYPEPPEEVEICVEVEQAPPYCKPLKYYDSPNIKPLAKIAL
ncbi:C-type lectin domain family 6 member A-like [Scaptodrosophila lebanonensis]|uniref:C-type lectin domain family 6 member A-like n=1 Tax=Drosophila lebanonensis TaxID=7225 RepID=A0A6J2U8E4_DROLE|nr:C-type lectin domain family 6 member A-like [Scaptodrosophila lebanonensis]